MKPIRKRVLHVTRKINRSNNFNFILPVYDGVGIPNSPSIPKGSGYLIASGNPLAMGSTGPGIPAYFGIPLGPWIPSGHWRPDCIRTPAWVRIPLASGFVPAWDILRILLDSDLVEIRQP